MRREGFGFWAIPSLLVLATVLCLPAQGLGQDSGGSSQAGVVVDAQGVLRKQVFADPTGMLTRQRIAAAKVAMDPNLVAPSRMRKVSLPRLEKLIRQRNGAMTDEMRNLAGLQRVSYVFCYPETGDIVIAGPAEGWITDMSGRVVGITSGQPVVTLQDLVVALRAFPPDKAGTNLIGCSIDPKPEGLAALNEFLRAGGTTATPADTPFIVAGLRESLGQHDITVNGVSPNTHFAQVMVEADYRMKLIGIGLETPPIRLASYVERANPSQVSRNALERWYFTPDYECVRATEDGLAVELVGDGVQLIGEGEMVSTEGERTVARNANRASQAFVNDFTRKYPALAKLSPVYAELRNIIDLSIAAAYMQREDFYDKAHWRAEFFGDEKAYSVETYAAPKSVETAVNAIWRGNRLMTPLGGGVTIEPTKALLSENLLSDERGQVEKTRQDVTPQLAEGQWWWD